MKLRSSLFLEPAGKIQNHGKDASYRRGFLQTGYLFQWHPTRVFPKLDFGKEIWRVFSFFKFISGHIRRKINREIPSSSHIIIANNYVTIDTTFLAVGVLQLSCLGFCTGFRFLTGNTIDYQGSITIGSCSLVLLDYLYPSVIYLLFIPGRVS